MSAEQSSPSKSVGSSKPHPDNSVPLEKSTLASLSGKVKYLVTKIVMRFRRWRDIRKIRKMFKKGLQQMDYKTMTATGERPFRSDEGNISADSMQVEVGF